MANTSTIELHSEYSTNWKQVGTILLYKSDSFQFNSGVLITELDNCLIEHITPKKIYDEYNQHNISIHADLISQLKKDCIDKSLIVLTNQFTASKLNIDVIKRKVETFTEKTNIPILVFAALKNNKFAKPHTGMWKLLKSYYKKYGDNSIKSAMVVSDEGGLIEEKVTKKGIVSSKIVVSDVDRAFAHNINAEYKTINEYCMTEGKKLFKWSSRIVPPDVRKLYCDEIEKYMKEQNGGNLDMRNLYNTFIFKELANFTDTDVYIIIVIGAPRSGKTTVCKNIIDKWRNSSFGTSHAIELLSQNEYSNSKRFNTYKKLLLDRISVVLDGDLHINSLQKQYATFADENQIPILYLEVNPGIAMAKLLNHVAVEDARDDQVILYKNDVFSIYKSMFCRPKVDGVKSRYIMYCPIINKKSSIMDFRY